MDSRSRVAMGLTPQDADAARARFRPPNFHQSTLESRVEPAVLRTQKPIVNTAMNVRWALGHDDPEMEPALECRMDVSVPGLERLPRVARKALVIGAGPSLDLAWDDLRRLADLGPMANLSVFAVDSVVPVLEERGCLRAAQYVVTSELDWPGVRPGFQGTMAYLLPWHRFHVDGLTLLADVQASHGYVRGWPRPRVLFYVGDVHRRYRIWWPHQEQYPSCLPVLVPRAPNVAFHAVELARWLGHDEVATVGLDMTTARGAHCARFGEEFNPAELQERALAECLDDLRRVHRGDFGVRVVRCDQDGVLPADFEPLRAFLGRAMAP